MYFWVVRLAFTLAQGEGGAIPHTMARVGRAVHIAHIAPTIVSQWSPVHSHSRLLWCNPCDHHLCPEYPNSLFFAYNLPLWIITFLLPILVLKWSPCCKDIEVFEMSLFPEIWRRINPFPALPGHKQETEKSIEEVFLALSKRRKV